MIQFRPDQHAEAEEQIRIDLMGMRVRLIEDESSAREIADTLEEAIAGGLQSPLALRVLGRGISEVGDGRAGGGPVPAGDVDPPPGRIRRRRMSAVLERTDQRTTSVDVILRTLLAYDEVVGVVAVNTEGLVMGSAGMTETDVDIVSLLGASLTGVAERTTRRLGTGSALGHFVGHDRRHDHHRQWRRLCGHGFQCAV